MVTDVGVQYDLSGMVNHIYIVGGPQILLRGRVSFRHLFKGWGGGGAKKEKNLAEVGVSACT